jgi:hypothetical protein
MMDFMYSTSKLFLAIASLLLTCIGANAQSGNAGGIKTTNQMSLGAVLTSDGTRMYWGPAFPGGSVTGAYSFAYPLELSGTSVTMRAEISRLTNFSAGISNVIYINSSSNIVSALSNIVSGTRYVLAKGAEWPVRANSVKSNGLAAINIFSKSNVEIVGYGATIYATNIGDVLYLTNCQNVQIEGLTLKGTVVTNYAGLGPIGVVWGALGYFACSDLRLYHNRLIDHHDHGVWDLASQGGSWRPATTNIQGRFNFFYNGGSMRTNESSSKDGTAIVPTGGDWTDNTIMYWMRGIEPYIENLSGSARVQNTLLARNRIINSMDDAILTAGSTNAHGLIIEDNIIEWHPGATWRGSNFIVSASGININAGQRVKILRNKIYYAPNFDIDVPGNLEKFGFVIEDNFGYGYFYGASGGGGLEVTSSSARMPNRGFSIKNNKFEFKRGFGIGLTGVRDSEISGNTLVNTGLDSTRQMWIYSDATTICSNLVIFGNHITSDERDTPTANGIDIENLTLATVLAGNTIYGQATSVNNLAGTEVTQYNFDDLSTDRFAAIRDLNVASNALFSAIGSGGGGGGAGSLPMNSNQFDTNSIVSLKNGLLGTNWTLRGVTLPTLTASRPAIIDGSGNLTNATGTPDGTKFLRDDGTLAVPAGGTGSTNPVAFSAGSVGVTNYFGLGFTNTGSNAVQVIDMMGPQLVRAFANGNTTLVLTNMPSWTNAQYGGKLSIQLRHGSGTVTLASLHPINFGRSFFIASGETNVITVEYAGQEVLGTLSHEPAEVNAAYASVVEIDQNLGQAVVHNITNRVTGNLSLVLTNPVSSRQLRINVIGEASGGTDRTVTLIPNTGSFVLNMGTFAQSKTNSFVFTLTNKNFAEITVETARLNGTNLWKTSVNQASFE